LNKGAGIVDTGTTFLLLATTAFNSYSKITGAILDQPSGMLKIPPEQRANMKDLSFIIGGAVYSLPPSAQVVPQTLNSRFGGKDGSENIYLAVGDVRDSVYSIVVC
jgi:hypothetical protein